MNNECNCGSGLSSHWEYDARGIPLAKVCSNCKAEKLSKFRREVLVDSNYECDEPIEPEDY
jgi:hypothetical protein